MASRIRTEGRKCTTLEEWTPANPKDISPFLAEVAERLPTEVGRPEEARTLKIDGLFTQGHLTAVVYVCPQEPLDLRQLMLNTPKPPREDRRKLCAIIAAQVRSLHTHFHILHPALRTESFIFFGGLDYPDLGRPFLLDWAAPAVPSIYQHPDYQETEPRWFYQIWSMLTILTEIVEWRLLNNGFRSDAELRRMKRERRLLATNPEWKASWAAEAFKFGFDFIDKDRFTLEQYGHWEIKRFYDRFCELWGPITDD